MSSGLSLLQRAGSAIHQQYIRTVAGDDSLSSNSTAGANTNHVGSTVRGGGGGIGHQSINEDESDEEEAEAEQLPPPYDEHDQPPSAGDMDIPDGDNT